MKVKDRSAMVDRFLAAKPMVDEQTRRLYPGAEGFTCPHGAVGDRLWVKETWARIYDVCPFDDGDPSHIEYRADGDQNRFPGEWPPETAKDPERPRWRSPWFLKRADSRIDLEITDVRVQRLHSISPVDVEAGGVLVKLRRLPWGAVLFRRGVGQDQRQACAVGE